MRQNYFWTFFVAILLIISSQVFADSDEKRVDEIKKTLACVCGCGMTLETCQGAMSCGAAEDMTSQIREMVSQKKTKEQIIKYFVNKYGQVVLAAPTKKGFNLTAWILPFLGLLIGIWVV
ncbi:MAG: cytochrome c-type biogenesis protein CcmH, partial [Candidatus Zixiibacteriota bacterium]